MVRITNRWTRDVLFGFHEAKSIKEAAAMAAKEGFNLSEANLRGADLRRSMLSGAHLHRADLREANLDRTALRGARLSGADLRGAFLEGVDLRVSHLDGADLRDANMVLIELQRAVLRGADLRGAKLRGANFEDADLRGVELQAADLTAAEFSGADLRGANLREVDLTEARLPGADLRWCDLRGANLKGAQLAGALLEGIIPSWSSPDLLAEILRREAVGDLDKRSYATQILEGRSRLWEDAPEYGHQRSRWEWALRTLARWTQPDDDHPKILDDYAVSVSRVTRFYAYEVASADTQSVFVSRDKATRDAKYADLLWRLKQDGEEVETAATGVAMAADFDEALRKIHRGDWEYSQAN